MHNDIIKPTYIYIIGKKPQAYVLHTEMHKCLHIFNVCAISYKHTPTRDQSGRKKAPNPANQRAVHASSGECVNTVESSVDLSVHLSLSRSAYEECQSRCSTAEAHHGTHSAFDTVSEFY